MHSAIPASNDSAATTETAAPRKRRPLAFSLRSFLLATAVLATVIGWTVHKAREQGRAVAALEKLGVDVEYLNDDKPSTLIGRVRKLLGEPAADVNAIYLNDP